MFRNYDLRFLIPYIILMLLLTGLAVWYEVAYQTDDSWPETIAAIGQGAGSTVSATFIIFATVEGIAYMVLALMRLRKLKEENEEKLAEGLQKGIEQGIEQGKKEHAVEAILTVLEERFKADVAEKLKPFLSVIDDLQRLNHLLRVATQALDVDTFTQALLNLEN